MNANRLNQKARQRCSLVFAPILILLLGGPVSGDEHFPQPLIRSGHVGGPVHATVNVSPTRSLLAVGSRLIAVETDPGGETRVVGASISLGSSIRALDTLQDVAWLVLADGRVATLDISSDPAFPVIASRSYESLGRAYNLKVASNTVFVYFGQGLVPFEANESNLRDEVDSRMIGLASDARELRAFGRFLIIRSHGELSILDVEASAGPQLVEGGYQANTPGTRTVSMAASQDHIFLAVDDSGQDSGPDILIFRIDEAGALDLAGGMDPSARIRSLEAKGRRLLVEHDRVIERFDISDPLQPISEGFVVETSPSTRDFADELLGGGITLMGDDLRIHTREGGAFFLDASRDWPESLVGRYRSEAFDDFVVDENGLIAMGHHRLLGLDPAAPDPWGVEELVELSIYGSSDAFLTRADEHIYMFGQDEINVFREDEAGLTQVRHIESDQFFRDAHHQEGLIYTLGTSHTTIGLHDLFIYQIETPTDLVETARIDELTNERVGRPRVQDRLYTSGIQGLRIGNMTGGRIEDVVEIPEFDVGSATMIAQGDWLYLGSLGGITIASLDDPKQPNALHRLDFDVFDMDVAGSQIVAAHRDGIAVLEHRQDGSVFHVAEEAGDWGDESKVKIFDGSIYVNDGSTDGIHVFELPALLGDETKVEPLPLAVYAHVGGLVSDNFFPFGQSFVSLTGLDCPGSSGPVEMEEDTDLPQEFRAYVPAEMLACSRLRFTASAKRHEPAIVEVDLPNLVLGERPFLKLEAWPPPIHIPMLH